MAEVGKVGPGHAIWPQQPAQERRRRQRTPEEEAEPQDEGAEPEDTDKEQGDDDHQIDTFA